MSFDNILPHIFDRCSFLLYRPHLVLYLFPDHDCLTSDVNKVIKWTGFWSQFKRKDKRPITEKHTYLATH